MSENSAIQINWKTKRDGMLINLRANTPEELDVLIDGITLRLATLLDLEQTTEGMATTNKAVEVITQAFPGAQPVQPPAPPAHNYAPTPPSPATGVPQCTCGAGEMRLVPAGISKSTGKPYRAFYACPRPQAQACKNRQNA